jgi:hypothetical protein
MLKLTKHFLLLCLIVLQLIAPFIHAHAFGLDNFKEHVFHVHADEIGVTSENQDTTSQAYLGNQQLIGAITTVATGNKASIVENVADSLATIAILFAFVLLLFSGLSQLIPRYFQADIHQQYFYSLQNPRAPPL